MKRTKRRITKNAKTIIVEATQLRERVHLQHPDGRVEVGYPGDWLVTGIANEVHIVKNDLFRRGYSYINHRSYAVRY